MLTASVLVITAGVHKKWRCTPSPRIKRGHGLGNAAGSPEAKHSANEKASFTAYISAVEVDQRFVTANICYLWSMETVT